MCHTKFVSGIIVCQLFLRYQVVFIFIIATRVTYCSAHRALLNHLCLRRPFGHSYSVTKFSGDAICFLYDYVTLCATIAQFTSFNHYHLIRTRNQNNTTVQY